jgi:hypothetical protein
MDFIKIFYNGLPAKVYKLLSSIPNNIESDVERFSYIHNLLSVDLGIESNVLFGSISDIQGLCYFYTEQHKLNLISNENFELVFDTDSMIVKETLTEFSEETQETQGI